MAVVGAVITVAVTATLLSATETDTASGQTLLVTNTDAASIFLGGAAVTTATGYPLATGISLPWPVCLGPSDQLYAISAAGTSAGAVKVIRVGV